MALKKGAGNPKKARARVSRDEEWVPSCTGEVELNRMVEVSVLPDRVTAGWRLGSGAPYPMPHTDEAMFLRITSGVG